MWVIFQVRTKQHNGGERKCSIVVLVSLACLVAHFSMMMAMAVDQWINYCQSTAAATDHQRLLGGGVVHLFPMPMYRRIPVRPMENGDNDGNDDGDGDEPYAAAIE